MEHPLITKVNRVGYISEPVAISECSSCDEPLYEGAEIIEWNGEHYCNSDCLVEFFLVNKEEFGVHKIDLKE